MLSFPEIDPVALAVGPIKVHWYGVMYLLGFAAAWAIGVWRAKMPHTAVQPKQVEDLIFYGAVGVVVGGRLGYVLFYGWDQFLEDPVWLLRIWQGGMAFHGGLLGVMVALALYARKINCAVGDVYDFVAPLTPIGLGLGRLANFVNGELYGRATDVSWAMVFPTDPQGLPRHPSQLYQCALEGVALFALLWWFARKPRPRWAVAALFVLAYGVARFSVEYFREPDIGIGLGWLGFSRGQWLSLPMIGLGILIIVWSYRVRYAAHSRNKAI